ncbi:hypothetical protein LguiB_027931 [Lonicera macranthoides]
MDDLHTSPIAFNLLLWSMTRNRPMTTSKIQRKTKQYVRKEKIKATPTELTSLIRESSAYNPGYSPSQIQTDRQVEEVVLEAPMR